MRESSKTFPGDNRKSTAFGNSKLQTPSSRKAPNSKLQAPEKRQAPSHKSDRAAHLRLVFSVLKLFSSGLNHATDPNPAPAETLCLSCGLCCNGVIFGRLKLQPEDDVDRLRALGLSIPPSNRTPHLHQPCAAFEGCRCAIYSERPSYCRKFECLLLKSVKAGQTSKAAALQIIATARKRADKVLGLLRALGDADESVALGLRFRRTTRRMEKGGLDEKGAATYSELTLAMHDLNLLLSEAFWA